MRQVEDRFNHKYNYPWTFMNDEPFTQEFRLLTTGMASGEVEYGLITHDEWATPPWIDTEKAQKAMEEMVEKDIIYGGSVSYRHMCRYNSGFFFRHPLVMKYEWYWRVEPGVDFYCTLDYDPFKFMRENNKVYGFVISMPEYWDTIPTLWDSTQKFVQANPQFLAENNSIDFIVDDHKGLQGDYNLCHFWSNFEIASLDFWRSNAYIKYFDYLDKLGGFYYERWGDAPVSFSLMFTDGDRFIVSQRRYSFQWRKYIGLATWVTNIALIHTVLWTMKVINPDDVYVSKKTISMRTYSTLGCIELILGLFLSTEVVEGGWKRIVAYTMLSCRIRKV
jgi:Glycolipid 2-alpha-mannosyltransferase